MLTFVIDGQALRREVKRAGVVRIPWAGPAARVRVVAWDAAGQLERPGGARPARLGRGSGE